MSNHTEGEPDKGTKKFQSGIERRAERNGYSKPKWDKL